MRFSVVINTYNRALALRQTLQALRYQTYADFEVVVVNGPSTDSTEAVLREFHGRIRALSCPEARLSMSRNIAVAEAAGDVIAFIDDDAIPTPTWLEELAAAYREPGVAAVGGLVYDQTGVTLQYRFAACNRDGRAEYDVRPPLDRYTRPMADPVAYLQGTNMSFSREVLREIGGFDENFAYVYDDVEICMQVIDRGYKLRSLDGAAVHHKFLASHVRNHKRIILDPYNVLFALCYFAFQHGRGTRTLREILDWVLSEANNLRSEAVEYVARGEMTPEQHDIFRRRLDEAIEAGLSQGMTLRRAGRILPPVKSTGFRPYPTLRPSGQRMKICFISREYPPGDFGGPGRHTHELAAGFAAAGHEVHVVTQSHDIYRVDLEEGAWVHRVPPARRLIPELEGVAALPHVLRMAAAYHEVCKIHSEGPVDLVVAPLWLCEGLLCTFDDRFATVTTLITANKAVATLADWARNSPEIQQLTRFEEELVTQSVYLHAISRAILERSVQDYQADRSRAFLAPLGMRDRSQEYPRRRPPTGRLRVLYVGRLETRKGAGVFLEAAVRLCPEFPDAEFVLAGKEILTDEGDTHRERFEKQYGHVADLRSRIIFTGMLSDEELYQHYADSDIFCLPTFYESFGQVYVEAMIWGKPIVGSHVGGVPEVVADGEQGYLVAPKDVNGVTEALRRLLADPGLRRRFGERSRELYEQKWATPVAVEHMEREFCNVVNRHRARSRVSATSAPPSEKVTRLTADALARAVGLPAETARKAATRLLDPRCYPIDHLAHFAPLWNLPPAEYVSHLYETLFGRTPRADEVEGRVATIGTSLRRIDVLRAILDSDEARRKNIPIDWVNELETLCGPGPFVPTEDATPITPAVAPNSIRQRISQSGVIGKLFKYVRRVIYLPWNFHKFYHEFGIGEHIVHATAERQAATERLISEELLPLLRKLAARQDGLRDLLWQKETQLHSAIGQQMTQVTHVLTELTEVLDTPRPDPLHEPSPETDELPQPPVPGQFRQAG